MTRSAWVLVGLLVFTPAGADPVGREDKLLGNAGGAFADLLVGASACRSVWRKATWCCSS